MMSIERKILPGMLVDYGEMRHGQMVRVICQMTVKNVGKRVITIEGSPRHRFRLDGSSTSAVYRDRGIVPAAKVTD